MDYSNASSSARTFLRHCEERFSGIRRVKTVKDVFERSKRRGNLPSLNYWRELFITHPSITSLQSQSKEIASRIRQRLAKHTLRTLQTETRNDQESVEVAMMTGKGGV